MSAVRPQTTPDVENFYHEKSGTISYVVSDPQTATAAIIDPVMGYCAVSGRTDASIAQQIVDFIRMRKLQVQWILETHAHADHLSAAQFVQAETGGKIAIGRGITDVQAHFGPVFNLKPPFAPDGHQFDHLFADGDRVPLGELTGLVMHTPGHTNDSVSYLFGTAAFIGDTLFMPDIGTARCDFPGGDAGKLYDSIQKLFSLPGETELYLCHDYPPAEREVSCKTTVAAQVADNIHVGKHATRDAFVAIRTARDATLALPALILPSIQVNIQAGRLPDREDNDIQYLKIPLDSI